MIVIIFFILKEQQNLEIKDLEIQKMQELIENLK